MADVPDVPSVSLDKDGAPYVSAYGSNLDVNLDVDGVPFVTELLDQPGMTLAKDLDGTPYRKLDGNPLKVKMGKVAITLLGKTRVNPIPPELEEVPGGLYPLLSAAFEVDEYRIMSGWPVPVPACDVRIDCLVTVDGTVLGDRDAPTSVLTNANLRWVADTAYYDETACQWAALQGEGMVWRTTPDYAPSLLTNYEYRINDERFVDMTVLNFDSNTTDYMWIDLNLIMGGASGYTVIMVINPNSIYGNDMTVTENALWGPPSYDDSWVEFSIKDQALYMTTEAMASQRGVPIGNALDSSAPSYVAMVVDRPQTTLYAASGPSRMLVSSLPAGPVPVPLNSVFWLGNAPSATVGTMDMALFDLGIYGHPLTKTEVVSEITTLSAVYGGDT